MDLKYAGPFRKELSRFPPGDVFRSCLTDFELGEPIVKFRTLSYLVPSWIQKKGLASE
jgi:hypothetical protein